MKACSATQSLARDEPGRTRFLLKFSFSLVTKRVIKIQGAYRHQNKQTQGENVGNASACEMKKAASRSKKNDMVWERKREKGRKGQ